MLDIHLKWLLVLIANFLGLIYILNIILYKPLLKVFKERQDTVKTSLDAAKEMNSRKDDGIVKMNSELASARSQAKEVFETMRAEGMARQKEVVSSSEAEAADMLQSARQELRTEAERARKALRADVEKFSDEIVRKLVKA
ncbi:MAG: ATP synthase F0 subunit B [Nitrospirae bacterium]|nr:ATP synthase F0 subunit B [Nitrospirota bacterium]